MTDEMRKNHALQKGKQSNNTEPQSNGDEFERIAMKMIFDRF